MPDSIREQIVSNVVTTLRNITTANSYANNVASSDVQRPNPSLPASFSNLRLLVHQGDPQQQEGSAPQKGREWVLPIQIICSVVESETSSTAIDSRLNSIAADVEKVLMVDHQRGGLAHNTIIRDPDYAPVGELQAHEGEVTVNIDVVYRTRWNDPYTQQ